MNRLCPDSHAYTLPEACGQKALSQSTKKLDVLVAIYCTHTLMVMKCGVSSQIKVLDTVVRELSVDHAFKM